MEQKQKSHIRPIVYVMITVFLTIGYAYLTSSLSINGSTLLKKPTWDVHFENIQIKDGSVTGNQVIQEPEIDAEQTTVTFHVNLKLPGDFYEFTVDAVNAGTIDAMVDNYSDLELTEDQQKYLETSITYEDGEEVLEHQQLLAGDTAVYKVRVGYKLDLEADDLPSNPEQLDLEFSVEFVQKDDTAIGRRAEKSLYNVLKSAAEEGTYGREYIGEHQDSFTVEPTKSIYYWFGSDDVNATTILDKWNVLFGGFCWQMIRTTDIGGVKLIYNGIPSDGKCNNTGTLQQIGTSKFNSNNNSLSYIGYMYNTVYQKYSKYISTETILSDNSLDTTYWYANSVTWGNPVTNRYNLDNPYQVTSANDYQNLVGKYTFRNTLETYTNSVVYYIVAVDDSTMYYIWLGNATGSTHNLSYYNYTYTYGNSYTKNSDDTYTINSPITVNRSDWYTSYSSIGAGKYVCKNAINNTCSDLWYTTSTSPTEMSYIKVTNNYKYANGFTYDENTNTYTLNNDSVSFWNIKDSTNITSLNTHHYTCWNETGECNTLSYVYYVGLTKQSYINLTDGKSIEDAKNEMLYDNDVNQTDSTIKAYIDNWYQSNMIEYTSYLDDTIFCNNRSQTNSSTNGWNPDGGSVTTNMKFNYESLKCSNEVDQFSVSNNKAKLTYPVGLASFKEMKLLFNDNTTNSLFNGSRLLRKTGEHYWLISPEQLDINDALFVSCVEKVGVYCSGGLEMSFGVRPVVSLKSESFYTSGDGSKNNPYVVSTN